MRATRVAVQWEWNKFPLAKQDLSFLLSLPVQGRHWCDVRSPMWEPLSDPVPLPGWLPSCAPGKSWHSSTFLLPSDLIPGESPWVPGDSKSHGADSHGIYPSRQPPPPSNNCCPISVLDTLPTPNPESKATSTPTPTPSWSIHGWRTVLES